MSKQQVTKAENLCSVDGCNNFRMASSDVCIECYQRISNEMSETVTSDECKPMPITERNTYIRLTELINGVNNENNT